MEERAPSPHEGLPQILAGFAMVLVGVAGVLACSVDAEAGLTLAAVLAARPQVGWPSAAAIVSGLALWLAGSVVYLDEYTPPDM